MTPNLSSTAPVTLPEAFPQIVSASNDEMLDAAGHRVIDLFSGNGAAILGHANPRIAHALKLQVDSVWITGGLTTPIHERAKSKLHSLLPDTHTLARFYSTGMEAAEFAIRMARTHTRRLDIVGFSRNMHGKSGLTAALGWPDAVPIPHVHRLPSFAELPEPDLLAQLEKLLKNIPTAAVFVEPVLGSGGGHVTSPNFCNQLIALCQNAGTLVVFDEILTGFHRTGPRFVHTHLAQPPDLILLGKALANGFPASAVAARRDIPVTPAMLPGSTFAGNPLAAAAILATLDEMPRYDLPHLVDQISHTIRATLGNLPTTTLRGAGALWMLELPSPIQARSIAERLYHRGVFLSYTANFLRLLPAATISPDKLQQACEKLRSAITGSPHA